MMRSNPYLPTVSSLLAGMLTTACASEAPSPGEEVTTRITVSSDETSRQDVSDPPMGSERHASSMELEDAPQAHRIACGPLPDPWRNGPLPDPWHNTTPPESCEGTPVDTPTTSNDGSGSKH
jgi:hypothetical protein